MMNRYPRRHFTTSQNRPTRMWGGREPDHPMSTFNNMPNHGGMPSWQQQPPIRSGPIPNMPMVGEPPVYGRPPVQWGQQPLSQPPAQHWGFPPGQQPPQWQPHMPPQPPPPQHQMGWGGSTPMYDEKKMQQQQMRMFGKPNPNAYPNMVPPAQQSPWTNPKPEGPWDHGSGVGTSKDFGQWGPQQGISPSHKNTNQQWGNEWQGNDTSRSPMQWHQQQPMSTFSNHQQWSNNCMNDKSQNENFNCNSVPPAFGSWATEQIAEPAPPSDMFWQDPNPKSKRPQKDSGTSFWGDPLAQQQVIRRWKEAEHEEFKKGPATATWTQGFTGWGDPKDTIWKPTAWEAGRVDDSTKDSQQGMTSACPDDNYRSQKTKEFLDQIRGAVAKGYLKGDILNQHLSSDKIRLVHSLLQRVYRMEQADAELEHLGRNMHLDFSSGVSGSVSKQEHDRLAIEIDRLRQDIARISKEIQSGAIVPRQNSSRLQQWQKKANNENVYDQLTNDVVYEQLAGSLQNLGISVQSSNSPSGSASGKAGAREFTPGKKWDWNDPAKVAEDPDATPSSMMSSFNATSPYDCWKVDSQEWKEEQENVSRKEENSEKRSLPE